jgi:hypothetical protein
MAWSAGPWEHIGGKEVSDVARIEGYRFGRVLVDGKEHTKDVIVLPGRVVAGWWRRDGHSLVLEDLEDVVDELPETLVVGAGADQRMRPDPGALDELRARGVDVQVLPTDQAVDRYGELDPGRTAAALHLTC